MGGQKDRWRPGFRASIRSFIALCMMFSSVANVASASPVTIGVDWGEEFVEVAIAFRGHKPDILLNDTGSRKFVNAVHMDGRTRSFDQKAAATLIKTPAKTVHKAAHILGTRSLSATGLEGVSVVPKDDVIRSFDQNGVAFDWDYMPYEFGVDANGDLHLNITKDAMLRVEEVAGHFFSYIKDIVMGKLRAAKTIKEEENPTILAVIAIPCNYTQKQRKAITFAAESAGITVAQLVHGITAASTLRAFEQDPGTKKLLFYDLGSSGANVGVIEIQVPSRNSKSANAVKETQVNVLSCVHQPGIGGRHHDVALAEHLRSIFETKTSIKLMPEHPHALQKLLKVANKAKVALTISESTPVAIEGLIRNTDFQREVITREIFNKTIEKSIMELQQPIDLALERAGGLTLEQLDGVELIGGAWRVPAVQEKLSSLLQPHPLGFHLNAEEAVAMGSGYLAAAHNPFFKMKRATIIDNSVHMYAIRISSMDKDHEDAIEKRTHLFKPEAKLHGLKSLVFKTSLDFKVELTENDLIIGEYEITGITEAMKKEDNVQKLAQITVVCKADDKGIIGIAKVSAFIVANETVEQTSNTEEEEKEGDKKPETPDANKEEGTKSEEQEKKEEQKPVSIEINVVMTTPDPFSSEKLEVSKKTIEEIRQRDINIHKCSERKNTLESLIYKYKSASKQKEFQAACDDETIESVKETLRTFEDWFDEESYGADLQEFEERIAKLQGLALPIYKRWTDNEARPALVASTNKTMLKLETTMKNLLEQKPYLTGKTGIIDSFNDVQKWWQDVQKEQEAQLPHQEPAFTAELVKLKLDLAREAIASLERIRPPKPSNETKPDDKEKANEAKSDVDDKEKTDEAKSDVGDKEENKTEQPKSEEVKEEDKPDPKEEMKAAEGYEEGGPQDDEL